MKLILEKIEKFKVNFSLTKKERKNNLVDELLADQDFKRLQKKRAAKINAVREENRGNPLRKKRKKTAKGK